MQFSDTTNDTGIIQDITFLTGVDLNAYSLKDRTRNINQWYQKIITMILSSQDEWDFDDTANLTGYPTATRPLVASQRDYLFSTALWNLLGREGAAAGSNAAISPLMIKRVDICYDGVGNTCYKAEMFDSGEYGKGLGNSTNEDSDFNKASPFVDVRDGGIWLYPMASASNVANSGVLRVEFVRNVDIFTTADTTQEPAIDPNFHRMLSLGASFDYAVAKGRENGSALQVQLIDFENRLRNYYGKKVKDRQIIMKQAFVDYS